MPDTTVTAFEAHRDELPGTSFSLVRRWQLLETVKGLRVVSCSTHETSNGEISSDRFCVVRRYTRETRKVPNPRDTLPRPQKNTIAVETRAREMENVQIAYHSPVPRRMIRCSLQTPAPSDERQASRKKKKKRKNTSLRNPQSPLFDWMTVDPPHDRDHACATCHKFEIYARLFRRGGQRR